MVLYRRNNHPVSDFRKRSVAYNGLDRKRRMNSARRIDSCTCRNEYLDLNTDREGGPEIEIAIEIEMTKSAAWLLEVKEEKFGTGDSLHAVF